MATEGKRVAEILASAKKQGRRVLLEHEAKHVLSAWGIPVARSELARDASEAVRIARELRYPVVMKIASFDIVHKSEAGGVKVGLSSELEVRQAFDEILTNARVYKPNANIAGVTMQEYLPPGKEVIIGAMQDPSFGATVMFGLGGIWVEVLKDVSFRLAPLSLEDAKEMIQEIKGYPVLAGLRGEPQVDVDAIADMLRKVGDLVYEFPEIAELDLNPVFAFDRGKGAIAVDARMILREDG
jgi:acyl-CoA synthetase (NDP forming)